MQREENAQLPSYFHKSHRAKYSLFWHIIDVIRLGKCKINEYHWCYYKLWYLIEAYCLSFCHGNSIIFSTKPPWPYTRMYGSIIQGECMMDLLRTVYLGKISWIHILVIGQLRTDIWLETNYCHRNENCYRSIFFMMHFWFLQMKGIKNMIHLQKTHTFQSNGN